MKQLQKERIPYRNRNHTGWWIASYLERFQWDDEDTTNLSRRCTASENTILVKASSREMAYRKAIAHGKLTHRSRAWSTDKTRYGRWLFEGLTSLLPVYDEIADCSEVLWRSHEGRTVRTVKSMVRAKLALEVFDDTTEPT